MIAELLLALASQSEPSSIVVDVCVPFVSQSISTEEAERRIRRDFSGSPSPEEADRDGITGVDIRYFQLADAGNRPIVVGLIAETSICTVDSPSYGAAYQTISRLEAPEAGWHLLPTDPLLNATAPSFVHMIYEQDNGSATVLLQLRPDRTAYIVTAHGSANPTETADSVDKPDH